MTETNEEPIDFVSASARVMKRRSDRAFAEAHRGQRVVSLSVAENEGEICLEIREKRDGHELTCWSLKTTEVTESELARLRDEFYRLKRIIRQRDCDHPPSKFKSPECFGERGHCRKCGKEMGEPKKRKRPEKCRKNPDGTRLYSGVDMCTRLTGHPPPCWHGGRRP